MKCHFHRFSPLALSGWGNVEGDFSNCALNVYSFNLLNICTRHKEFTKSLFNTTSDISKYNTEHWVSTYQTALDRDVCFSLLKYLGF